MYFFEISNLVIQKTVSSERFLLLMKGAFLSVLRNLCPNSISMFHTYVTTIDKIMKLCNAFRNSTSSLRMNELSPKLENADNIFTETPQNTSDLCVSAELPASCCSCCMPFIFSRCSSSKAGRRGIISLTNRPSHRTAPR